MSTAEKTRMRALDPTVDVETPESVVLTYTLAGVGSRAAAAIIDYLFCLAIFLVIILFLVTVLSAGGGLFGRASTPWLLAVLVVAQFVIVWGYYVLFEGLRDGQTLGKQMLRLRVVEDGGFSVTFASSAIRNLARAIDLQPGLSYGVGLVSIASSKSAKRIGDMMAGTVVVRERVVAAPRQVDMGTAPAQLETLLTDDEFSVLARFAETRYTLEPDRRARLTEQLAVRFRTRAAMPDLNDGAMLSALFTREQSARSRGVAARSDTGAAREQHAIVAEGAARWAAFAARLASVQSKGLKAMPEEEISDFVAQYRELSSDLARLKTATRGRDVTAVFSLSRLVAGAHNLLYRQRGPTAISSLSFITEAVPAEIRRSARPILLAAFLMFAPAAIAYTAVVTHPSVAPQFIPAGMIERANEGVSRATTDDGYIEDPQLFRPVMASSIVTNNVQVTIFAFAFGATAGIGTVLLLVINGVSLGGVLGLYQSKGILNLILAFVAPHGVLELGAICIAGGAGLLIASAMLIPGNRTRTDALAENGRRAIRLIAGSTMLLVIAGTLEGFVSPIPWFPLSWKLAISGVTAVFFAGYISLTPTVRVRPVP